MNPKKFFAVIGTFILAIFFLAACDNEDKKSGQTKETNTQQSNYNRLVSQDPAHTMAVSGTRKTINGWIDTWGKDPNKIAYVYFQNDEGKITNYFAFKGLPVSYCTSLTPNYQLIATPGDGNGARNQQVPAPSIDGVYYSGGECNRYYGFDANTGS